MSRAAVLEDFVPWARSERGIERGGPLNQWASAVLCFLAVERRRELSSNKRWNQKLVGKNRHLGGWFSLVGLVISWCWCVDIRLRDHSIVHAVFCRHSRAITRMPYAVSQSTFESDHLNMYGKSSFGRRQRVRGRAHARTPQLHLAPSSPLVVDDIGSGGGGGGLDWWWCRV